MSEKTLEQVGKDAENDYSNHRLQAIKEDQMFQLSNKANGKYWSRFNRGRSIKAAYRKAEQAGVAAQEAADEYTDGLRDSSEFARSNAEDLHDLAVIEAHLAGVAINVAQPVVAGQKVEVHNTEEH